MTARSHDDCYFEELAARLDRFAHVPDDVLWTIVTGENACMWLFASELEPDCVGDALTDREAAALLCAGCTVTWACLELELRSQGGQALGVWGGLPAEDIRALYPVWRARRQDGGRR
jgi:WhiB family transcriptional regulator, redox-sensing transcriptional regulator